MPRSSKQGNDVAVQGTNDSSIVSKCSTAAQGYFDDNFLRLFVSKTSRRAPLINRGYYIRAQVLNDVFKQFLSAHHGKKQIISLGAGFDSAFFRLRASGLLINATFFEVDFPDVVRRKATIIKTTTELRQQLGEEMSSAQETQGGIFLTSHGYHLLGVDLADLPHLQSCLKQTGIDYQLPTLLLSECVLTYMEVRSSDAVIQWAASSFSNAVFLTYEQIHPSDAFGMVMRRHFEKLNSPLKAIQRYPTLEAQQQRFLSLGWQGTGAVDMNTYYSARLPLKERLRVESLEPFDEFEEWHLKCSHYAVIAGCSGTCSHLVEFLSEGNKQNSPRHQRYTTECTPGHSSPLTTCLIAVTSPRPLRRFGHASSLLSPQLAMVVGGFGESGSRHTRLGDVVMVDLRTGRWKVARGRNGDKELEPVMHHTLTAIPGGNRWLLFGGRSSPSRPSNSTLILTLDTKRATAAAHSDSEMATVSSSFSTDGNLILPSAAVDTIRNGVSSQSNSSVGTDEIDNSESSQVWLKDSRAIDCQLFSGCSQGISPLDEIDSACNQEEVTSERKFPDWRNTEFEMTSYNCQYIETQNSDGPVPRWRHSAVYATVRGKECVVVYGGRGADDAVLGDCWAFDVRKLDWERLEFPGDQPPASHSHSACAWQNTRMIIAGGLGPNLRPFTSVHVVDLEKLRCQEIKLQPTLPPRYSHTAHVVGSSLLLVGGVNPLGGQGYTIAVVDLESATWRLHSLPACVVERPLMVHSHTSELLTDTRMAILGGGGNCFSFGTHLNDTPVEIGVPL
ncbi:tRNA wybutosine-synthesizing protein 4-like [Acanthaster planci]|uniref:tRNA wybutosine-synthesizing protein 4 n=1 Tax=Acanthaster planci TaxID=133434 RepID=A0A8B7ZUY3_ACAPL|nr:tRNA wybutosine-synthesizing protein 4-like [Acanthaster planci]